MTSAMKERPTQPHSEILFAVLGVSPAVLTETIWALAHEEPHVVPNYVLVLTTSPGQQAIEQVLFRENGWNRLIGALEKDDIHTRGRLRFGKAGDHIRQFPSADGSGNLHDIANALDSEAAADFIMRSLREFTEDFGTRVIASIAGGRKTMSALLTSCMILLGRRRDRLCHVLVNPPYDSPELSPRFLFPEAGVLHRLPGRRRRLASTRVKLELIDIPFVRVRGWYEREYGLPPPSYMALVRQIQGVLPNAAIYPQITVDMPKGLLLIDKDEIQLSSAEFALLSILAQRAVTGNPLHSWSVIEEEVRQLQKIEDAPVGASWLHDFRERKFDPKEDARKLAAGIRKKIKRHFPEPAIAYHLIPSPKAGKNLIYPAGKIKIRRLHDVK